MDDDIWVDLFQLLSKLESDFPYLEDGLVGFKQTSLRPIRNPKSKWFVSRREYPRDEYPDFLSGWAYVTTPAMAAKLVDAADRERPFWIDDVWVTGVLASSVGARLETINSLFTVYAEQLKCCLKDHPADNELGRYRCDFIVGPTSDDGKLLLELGELSLYCQRHGCGVRPWQKSVVNTCVKVDNPYFLPESKGEGEVIVLKGNLL